MKKNALLAFSSARLSFFPFALFLFISLITSCKKEQDNGTIEIPRPELLSNSPIPSYYFDWETVAYMPSMPTPGSNNVPMPWNSGTTAIDPNIVADYKKSEGWELVWNTFSPSIQLNDPGYYYFFSLYNKYRGTLRFYLWQPATPLATTYVNHGLKLYPTSYNSSMLNYNVLEYSDVANNQKEFTQVLNQQINVAGGTWMVFQYEIAYDPAIANTTFPSFGIELNAKWVNVSNILLNGTQAGEIKGYVGSPNTSTFDLNSQISSGVVTLAGKHANESFMMLIGKNDPNKYTSAMTNALGDVVKGFLNALIGGSDNSIKPVNLTINTKIKLDGQMISNGGIINNKLALPGQLNSQTADGLTPHYNSLMGVFNVSNRPTINIKKIPGDFYSTDPWDNPVYETYVEHQLKLDRNSFSILWNPAIINSTQTGASIENLQIQMVQRFKESTVLSEFPSPGDGTFLCECVKAQIGTLQYTEQIGNYPAFSSIPNASTSMNIGVAYMLDFPPLVRISFDVAPNNGSPKSKVVKTFAANVVYQ